MTFKRRQGGSWSSTYLKPNEQWYLLMLGNSGLEYAAQTFTNT